MPSVYGSIYSDIYGDVYVPPAPPQPATSCNELTDGTDPDMYAYWSCQDNAASPVITSPNGREIPLTGNVGASTEDISVDGPTPWIPRALRMRGFDVYAELIDDFNQFADEFTILCRSRTLEQDGFEPNINASVWRLRDLSVDFFRVVPVRSTYPNSLGWYRRFTANVTFDNAIDGSLWQHTAMINSVADNVSSLHLDGSIVASSIAGVDADPSEFRIGGGSSLALIDVADMLMIARRLTPEEIQEHIDGPEPLPLGIPGISGSAVVGEILSVISAPWDDRNNGSLTLQWQWYRSKDGTFEDIAGATGPDYTVAVGDVGWRIGVRELAGNDGGVDVRQWVGSAWTSPIAMAAPLAFESLTANPTIECSLSANSTLGGDFTAMPTLDCEIHNGP